YGAGGGLNVHTFSCSRRARQSTPAKMAAADQAKRLEDLRMRASFQPSSLASRGGRTHGDSFADQPPDRSRLRNTQICAPDFPATSETSKKRTKCQGHQLGREGAVERAKTPLRRQPRSSGSAQKPRRYWAFEAPAEAPETVCSGRIGGPSGIRTVGTQTGGSL